jgi:cysteine desulfurase
MTYLDNNATTRPGAKVVAAMNPYWTDRYFNPASVAGELMGISAPITAAKRALANLIGCEPIELTLTSGATEANNWAIQSTTRQSLRQSGTCSILVSAIEHPSVLEVARELESENFQVKVTLIPVEASGQINLSILPELVAPDTALISIMLANNESGVIQPVAEASTIIKQIAPGCLIHCDATQAIGKIRVDLSEQLALVDMLSLSAHKFYGPKGIGALFVRQGTNLPPLILGGGQQGGMRAGTENPALAAGFAKAAECASNQEAIGKAMDEIRSRFEAIIQERIIGIKILGKFAPRLPNTTLLVFPDHEGEFLVHQLAANGFVTSTGSACSNGSDRPSHVLTAMGIDYGLARNALRISISTETTYDDMERFIEALISIL